MEDAHIASASLLPNMSLFAVFDGHGGPEIALTVSKIFSSFLTKNKHFQAKDYEKALTETFIEVDAHLQTAKGLQDLKKHGQMEESQTQAGCTANVVLIVDHDVYVANAGDSRAILKNT